MWMQALSFLTPATLERFVGPMRALLQRMEAQLAENPELLTDQGRDRMFASASGSLSRINKLLAVALSVQEADKQVRVCHLSLLKWRQRRSAWQGSVGPAGLKCQSP